MKMRRALPAVILAASLLTPAGGGVLAQDDTSGTTEETLTTLLFTSNVESPDDAEPTYSGTISGPGGVIPVSQSAIENLTGIDVPAQAATYTFTLSDPGPDWAVTDIKCETAGTYTADIPARTATLTLAATDAVGGCNFHIGSGLVTLAVHKRPEDGPIRPSATVEREDGNTILVTGAELAKPGGHEERYPPGVHEATLEDPGPNWVVTDVVCIEQIEDKVSEGDTPSRVATLGVDGGDMVGCIYQVDKRGKAIIKVRTEPRGKENEHWYTVEEIEGETHLARGSRSGKTYPLRPGISKATLQDPGDRWTLTAVDCTERDTTTVSSGDVDAMTAELAVDPDDKVTCTFKLRDETVPSTGQWRVNEVSAEGKCKGQPVDIETGGGERWRLQVRNKGQLLVGGGGRLSMRRTAADNGTYRGTSNSAKLRWKVLSHDHMVGTTTIGDEQCTFVRTFDMRLIRD